MLQRVKNVTVPFAGDGGALGALTALATQAAVQSNVQPLSWAKRSSSKIFVPFWNGFHTNVWSIVA